MLWLESLKYSVFNTVFAREKPGAGAVDPSKYRLSFTCRVLSVLGGRDGSAARQAIPTTKTKNKTTQRRVNKEKDRA